MGGWGTFMEYVKKKKIKKKTKLFGPKLKDVRIGFDGTNKMLIPCKHLQLKCLYCI